MIKIQRVKFSFIKDILFKFNFSNYPGPFLDFDYFKIVRLGYSELKPFDRIRFKELNYVVYNNDSPIVIGLFFFDIKRKYIYFRGEINSNFNDLIYDYNYSFAIKALFDHIKKTFPNSIIFVNRIIKYSNTYQILLNEYGNPSSEELCGKISNLKSYNTWLSKLTKSFKQNLRTTYNKLNNNKIIYKLFVVDNNKRIGFYNKLLILYLFSKRLLQHSNYPIILLPFLIILKLFNPFSKYLFSSNKQFHAILFYNNYPVAFVSGFKYSNVFYIPRLSINYNYRKYNPGFIIISEIVKYIGDRNLEEFTIDLTRGGENYKYDYGGEPYYICNWIIK